MRLTVLIVDDHQLVLDGLSLILSDHDHIEIIGEAHNGQEAIDFILDQRVDVVVMDLNMPILNGVDACQKIKEIRP